MKPVLSQSLSESPLIAPLTEADFAQWLPLWNANNNGQEQEKITAVTWQRLTDPDYDVYGLAVRLPGDKSGVQADVMAGFLHYILHPVTGQIRPVCYMQDLYIDPAYRRRGYARMLVSALYQLGKTDDWARLYWLADESNEAAQALYNNLGLKLDFSFHILPIA